MRQEGIITVGSISELVDKYKQYIDTGQMFRILGVSITPANNSRWRLGDEKMDLPCLGRGVDIQKQDNVNITVTYHGSFLTVYEIMQQTN